MEFLPEPQLVGLFLAGCAMIALAAWVLWLDFGSRLHQTFALFMVVRGMMNLLSGWGFVIFAMDAAPGRMVPYFSVAIAPLALLFAYEAHARYGRRRPSWRRRNAAALGAIAAIGVLEALYAWNHDLYGRGTQPDFRGGPLLVFDIARIVAYGVVALALAVAATRVREEPRRRSLLVLSVAFALNGSFLALFITMAETAVLFGAPGPGQGVWFHAANAVAVLGLPPLVAAVVVLRRHARRARDPALRREADAYGKALLAVAALVLVTGVAFLASAAAGRTVNVVADGLTTLAFSVLVAYAIVRHRLFDIDVKLRWTVRHGTLAGIFVGVFLVAQEAAQQLLSTSGQPWGLAAAALLVLAIQPMQRLADRVSRALVPRGAGVARLDPRERAALYREWARVAWEDDAMSGKERRMLDAARERLGLSAEEANHLEREALRMAKG